MPCEIVRKVKKLAHVVHSDGPMLVHGLTLTVYRYVELFPLKTSCFLVPITRLLRIEHRHRPDILEILTKIASV